MKPKPIRLDPNAAGDEVLRLLKEDGNANAELKDIRSAKAARKEQLKKALTIVWDAFEKKKTVNGFATRKEWCAGFAKVTPRHCEHILYGRTKTEANSRSLTIKDGDIVSVKRWDGEKRIVEKWKVEDGGAHGIWLRKVEGEERPASKKEEKKPAKPAPSTHIRFSPRKAWCQTRFVNRKIKGLVFAKNDEVTCPDCVKMHEESKTPKRLETDETLYTETCLTCGNQRTDDESNTLVTIPASPSESTKALDETVETAEVPELTWAQKVCIPGSPEREQWAADLLRRRENPYIDPNEAYDESEVISLRRQPSSLAILHFAASRARWSFIPSPSALSFSVSTHQRGNQRST